MRSFESAAMKAAVLFGAALVGAALLLKLWREWPLALLVLAAAAAAGWAGSKSGRGAWPGLLVPLCAGLFGWAFSAAVQAWLELVGKGAQAVVWQSWLAHDPLSNPANRAGRIGVVIGSFLGLAAPWIAGRLAGRGEKNGPARVHGLRVADSAAKGTSRWAGERDVPHVAEFGPPREGLLGGGTVVGAFAPFPKAGEKPGAGLFGRGRIVRIRPEKCVPPLPAHAAAGAALGALVGGLGPAAAAYVGAAVGALAALLPDLDHPGARAGRWLRPVSVWLEWKYRHRESPTHTILFAVLAGLALGLLALPLAGLLALLSGVLGGASHLVLDALTRSGVAPFRPWSARRFAGPLTTGGPAEWVVVAAVAVMAAVLG